MVLLRSRSRVGIASILLLETVQAVEGIAKRLLDILVAHGAASVVIRAALRAPLIAAIYAAVVAAAGVLLCRAVLAGLAARLVAPC